MTDGLSENDKSDIMAHTPMNRRGAPSDIAGVALYLASKASAFVCGASISVDGGLATTA
jgi:NAD(P)-dependent dehydrogenase (short-subunit alcohol dehydrogenase family)